jgi:SAM-dependent methyltransferase
VRRMTLDGITRLLGWLRRSRQVGPPSMRGPVKVNLGSSLLVADGWINIDGSLSALLAGWPRPALRAAYRLTGISGQLTEEQYVAVLTQQRFIHHNLEYGIPLPADCAHYVFASHFLEHLTRRHGEQLVREALRVLRPGGVIRLAVPDLAARGMGDGKGAMAGDFEDPHLGYFARHRCMYDFGALAELVTRAGFVDARRCELRQGRVPDLEVLDNRPGSLFVEAAKPG